MLKQWYGEGCGNSFLILLGGRREMEKHIEYVRNSDQWTFDTALLLEPNSSGIVSMRVLEKDGSESNMCGNGARVVGRVLQNQNLPLYINVENKNLLLRETDLGIAVSLGRVDRVEEHDIYRDKSLPKLDLYKVCGEPHAVIIVDDIKCIPLVELGSKITSQYNVNCTVVSQDASGDISARTFERGVNAVTLSCGTGAVSSVAALFKGDYLEDASYKVSMPGGDLHVSFSSGKAILEGPAVIVENNILEENSYLELVENSI